MKMEKSRDPIDFSIFFCHPAIDKHKLDDNCTLKFENKNADVKVP